MPLLLAMENGGSDIIELGMPFSDPLADGPSIQETNAVRGQLDHTLQLLTVRPDSAEEQRRIQRMPAPDQEGKRGGSQGASAADGCVAFEYLSLIKLSKTRLHQSSASVWRG